MRWILFVYISEFTEFIREIYSYRFRFRTRGYGGTRWTQLVTVGYKPEGRLLDSRWCNWNFPLTFLTEMSARIIYCGVKTAGA
jgi:hypothetical protein